MSDAESSSSVMKDTDGAPRRHCVTRALTSSETSERCCSLAAGVMAAAGSALPIAKSELAVVPVPLKSGVERCCDRHLTAISAS